MWNRVGDSLPKHYEHVLGFSVSKNMPVIARKDTTGSGLHFMYSHTGELLDDDDMWIEIELPTSPDEKPEQSDSGNAGKRSDKPSSHDSDVMAKSDYYFFVPLHPYDAD